MSDECQHLIAEIVFAHGLFVAYVSVRSGLLSCRQRREVMVARCAECRDYLSLGRTRELYVDVRAAAVAATARDGLLGRTDLGEEWSAGVAIGWSIHEDASVGRETYDVVKSLSTKDRRAGYLARQIYLHSVDGSRLSVEGQRTYAQLLEKYGNTRRRS